jgi:signal transduction histidine kinase/DNA-binding response OmpR family regulator/ABC-type sugar transport system substrate-binding protein
MMARPTIGVVASWQVYVGTLHSFLGPLYRGLRSAGRDLGCNLLLSCGIGPPITRPWDFRPAWPVPSPDVDFVPVGPWNVDGLIAVTPLRPEQSRYFQKRLAEGYPVVFAGAGERGPTVVVDNEGGVRQAMAHLVEHGHRHVAFIAAAEYDDEATVDDSTYRRLAYQSAVEEFGLASEPDLIVCGYNSVSGGAQAAQQLLDSGVSFTAIVASNDEAAIGAMDTLSEAGFMVPQDVAVIGFDNRLEAVAHVPPLTTVHHPTPELGYQALALLLEILRGRTQGEQILRVPTRLVIRESCGCLPGTPTRTAIESAVAELEAVGQAEVGEGIGLQVAYAMGQAMCAEMQRMSPEEVHHSCERLVEAFVASLEENDGMIFRLAMQQVLQRVMTWGDDLYAWQAAVSILREQARVLLETVAHPITRRRVEDLLDQARIAISETARSQYTRHLMHQADVADQVEQMAAQFLGAHDADEIFETLVENLPQVGIGHAAVAFYEAEGADPVAWSLLQTPHKLPEKCHRFPSRRFPPEGLYPNDERFSLALLPLHVHEDLSGFVAFDAGALEPCAAIVRQLAAALRSIRLYQEAVEGRRLAEEANHLKGRFLSMVSHELRTPLNLIIGVSDILLQEARGQGQDRWMVSQEDVQRIHASAQHLDGLIRDVLDLARSEAGQLRLVREPLDLAEVLEVVVAIGEQLAQTKGLRWRAEIPEDLPTVYGDRTRLRQVALNLVNNAVKFTTHGEIVLTVAAEDDSVMVAVRDTGLGIPLGEQEVIFDEFRQSERSTARGYGGLGLGLAICRRLVEMHGGRIGVLSLGKEGAGSTFYFTLPALERQPTAPTADVSLAGAQQVLLLVKDAGAGDLLKDHLSRQGFAVQMHQVGERADWLTWLLAGPPEAVVLDLGLASESGWEVLRVLKGNPATQDVPVLFYTVADAEDRGSVLEIGYLTKPVGTSELAEALMSRGLLDGAGPEDAGKKILVVDDEPEVLEMHARIVEAQLPDAHVLRARHGREALNVIHSQQLDLVILDLMMPELDGFGVLEAMREDGISRDTPVIVLTGQVLTEEDMARLNRGVSSVLGKGLFTVDETLQHVEATLAHRRSLGAETQRVVRKALAYMHEHYAEPVSRGEVAAYVGLSQGHLTRSFREEMGVTPVSYLNRYRVRQAKALLEAGEMSIAEVALEVGFSDSQYFARVFRREAGTSPSAYRRGTR